MDDETGELSHYWGELQGYNFTISIMATLISTLTLLQNFHSLTRLMAHQKALDQFAAWRPKCNVEEGAERRGHFIWWKMNRKALSEFVVLRMQIESGDRHRTTDSDHRKIESKHEHFGSDSYCWLLKTASLSVYTSHSSHCRLCPVIYCAVALKTEPTHWKAYLAKWQLAKRMCALFLPQYWTVATCSLSFSHPLLNVRKLAKQRVCEDSTFPTKLADDRGQLWVKLAMAVMNTHSLQDKIATATTFRRLCPHKQIFSTSKIRATLMVSVAWWANQWWQFQLEHLIKKQTLIRVAAKLSCHDNGLSTFHDHICGPGHTLLECLFFLHLQDDCTLAHLNCSKQWAQLQLLYTDRSPPS